jgi:hypothetical protein
MKKRFIVGIDSLTPEQDKEFVEYLQNQKCGWWHWITNLWLVSNRAGHLSAKEIRDEVIRLAPNARALVVEINEPGTWSGKGPNSKDLNMFEWLKETWEKD